jgi:hypothetical protein
MSATKAALCVGGILHGLTRCGRSAFFRAPHARSRSSPETRAVPGSSQARRSGPRAGEGSSGRSPRVAVSRPAPRGAPQRCRRSWAGDRVRSYERGSLRRVLFEEAFAHARYCSDAAIEGAGDLLITPGGPFIRGGIAHEQDACVLDRTGVVPPSTGDPVKVLALLVREREGVFGGHGSGASTCRHYNARRSSTT